MTNKEAVNLLDNLIGMITDSNENNYDNALKMGIEALENQKSIAEELEEIKQEITNIQIETCTIPKTAKDIQYEALWILDNHISELKGENK